MNHDFGRYFRLARVGLATVVSFCLLVQLWRDGELYGKSGAVFCFWFVAAGALQAFSTSPGWWATGLVAQALLAIVLLLKRQINRIY
jgi:hypothetical protein